MPSVMIDEGLTVKDEASVAVEDVKPQVLVRQHTIQKTPEAKSELKRAMALQSMVYGGCDGVITTFACLSGAYAAKVQYGTSIVLTVACLLADAISMGYGDFISTSLQVQFVNSVTRRFTKAFRDDRKRVLSEMANLLNQGLGEGNGLDMADAQTLSAILAKNEALFVQTKMAWELDLDPDTPSTLDIAKDAQTTFWSFLFFGFMPLAVYLVGLADEERDIDVVYAIACVVTAIALFSVGVAAAFVTHSADKEDRLIKSSKNGLFTMLNGGLAAVVAYVVGWALEKTINHEDAC